MTLPRDVRPILQEAMALHQKGDMARAEMMYRDVLTTHPDEPNAWHLLGVISWQRGDLAPAEASIRKAIGFQNTSANYFCNLGGVLKQLGDFPEALVNYNEALRLMPDYPDARNGLLDAYAKYGQNLAVNFRWDEAKEIYQALLLLNPMDDGAANNLAQILHNEGNAADALSLYDRALTFKPSNGLARYNRGICKLGQNDLPGGYADLQQSVGTWLPLIDSRPAVPWLHLALWDKVDISGKSILVWGDQGIGDEILYASLLTDLLSKGAKVTLECAPRLLPLFKRSFPDIEILPRQSPPLPGLSYDFQAPGPILASLLRPSFTSFPKTDGYLKPHPVLTSSFQKFYRGLGQKNGTTRIIGLSWHTKTLGQGVSRRIDLEDLVAVLPTDGITYIDLQYGDTVDERKSAAGKFPHFKLFHDDAVDQLLDMEGFVAQVAACDAVITIGNTTAHVAGALGVPSVALLPVAGLTWFWFDHQSTCPWYPHLHLLRKETGNNWEAALKAVPVLIGRFLAKPEWPRDEDAEKALSEALHKHGLQMMGERNSSEAMLAYRQVLRIDPGNRASLNNLAMVLQHTGHRAEGRAVYDEALAAEPNNLTMRYNRSIGSLTEGRLQEGWADFTLSEPYWIKTIDKRVALPWMASPIWDGSNLKGKSILVWGDMGIGEEILFLGLIPDLISQGAVITIECLDRLTPLVKRSFPGIRVHARSSPPSFDESFDFHAPYMWLARQLRPDNRHFSGLKSYFKSDLPANDRLRDRYRMLASQHGRKQIIGISWYTSSHPWGLQRSLPLGRILEDLPLKDLLIVDLQYGDTSDAWKEAKAAFPDLLMIHDDDVNQFKDMDMFAAQVASCDGVLTIANTTAHIAGALGVPAQIFMADVGLAWYWFDDSDTCLWYPSLRLHRPSDIMRFHKAAAFAAAPKKV